MFSISAVSRNYRAFHATGVVGVVLVLQKAYGRKGAQSLNFGTQIGIRSGPDALDAPRSCNTGAY